MAGFFLNVKSESNSSSPGFKIYSSSSFSASTFTALIATSVKVLSAIFSSSSISACSDTSFSITPLFHRVAHSPA